MAHVSDFHFDGSQELDVALRTLVNVVKRRAPDLVVVTGDLTASGRADELEAVAGYLTWLSPIPCLVIPGNRDLEPSVGPPGEARSLPVDSDLDYFLALEPSLDLGFAEGAGGPTPEAEFGARFGALEAAYGTDSVLVVGVNSAPRLRLEAIERAARRLRRAPPTALRVFALHHGLLPIPGRKLRDGDLSARAGDLLALLCDLEVDVALHGHVHRAHAWQVSDGRHTLVVSSAGALVNDGRRDASFNELLVEDGRLEIWRRSLAKGKPQLLYAHGIGRIQTPQEG